MATTGQVWDVRTANIYTHAATGPSVAKGPSQSLDDVNFGTVTHVQERVRCLQSSSKSDQKSEHPFSRGAFFPVSRITVPSILILILMDCGATETGLLCGSR